MSVWMRDLLYRTYQELNVVASRDDNFGVLRPVDAVRGCRPHIDCQVVRTRFVVLRHLLAEAMVDLGLDQRHLVTPDLVFSLKKVAVIGTLE